MCRQVSSFESCVSGAIDFLATVCEITCKNNFSHVGPSRLYSCHVSMMLDQRGEKMTVEEVQTIIDEVDENRDGKLNYKEVKLLHNV